MRIMLALLTVAMLAACAPPNVASRPLPRTNMLTPASTPTDVQARLRLYEAAVAENLRDPSSARFRGTRLVTDSTGEAICGEVNATNAYGGYTGFQPFFAQINAPVNDTRLLSAPAPWMPPRISYQRIMAACGG